MTVDHTKADLNPLTRLRQVLSSVARADIA